MYNTSAAYKTAIQKTQQFRDIKITFDGQTLTPDSFISGSPEIEMSCMSNNVLQFGATVSKFFSCSLQNKNSRFNGTNFKNKTLIVQSGIRLEGGSYEYVPCGTFKITSAGKPYASIKIEAADKMLETEKTYASSPLVYPASLYQIAADVASKIGVTMAGDFYNSSYIVQEAPDRSDYTYRDILGFVAEAAGGFARITRNNQLEIVCLADNANNTYTIQPDKTRIETETDEIISITGLAYYGENGNILLGTDDYPIVINTNPLLANMAENSRQAILNNLYTKYSGFTYYPVDLKFAGDPALDEGDFIYLPNTIDGNITTFIGSYTVGLTGTERIRTPSCSELDKNFYDTHGSSSGGGGGGGGGGFVQTHYTHNEFAPLNRPIHPYDVNTGTSGGAREGRFYLTFKNPGGGVILNPQNFVAVLCNTEIAADKSSGGSEQHAYLDENGIAEFDQLTYRNLDVKLYTIEEYESIKQSYRGYDEDLWPDLHELSPNRLITQTGYGPITLRKDITVNTSRIAYSDTYYNVREKQLADWLFYINKNILKNTTFTSFFADGDAVYRSLLGFRHLIDGEMKNSGTSGAAGGMDPSLFSNPLGAITNAQTEAENDGSHISIWVDDRGKRLQLFLYPASSSSTYRYLYYDDLFITEESGVYVATIEAANIRVPYTAPFNTIQRITIRWNTNTTTISIKIDTDGAAGSTEINNQFNRWVDFLPAATYSLTQNLSGCTSDYHAAEVIQNKSMYLYFTKNNENYSWITEPYVTINGDDVGTWDSEHQKLSWTMTGDAIVTAEAGLLPWVDPFPDANYPLTKGVIDQDSGEIIRWTLDKPSDYLFELSAVTDSDEKTTTIYIYMGNYGENQREITYEVVDSNDYGITSLDIEWDTYTDHIDISPNFDPNITILNSGQQAALIKGVSFDINSN